jgi:hypothetical protein
MNKTHHAYLLLNIVSDYIYFVREKQEDNTTINNHTSSSLSERFVLNISEFHVNS